MTPTSVWKVDCDPSSIAARSAMVTAAVRGLNSVSRAAFSWKPTGGPQQTLAAAVSRWGVGLHSGGLTTATLLPARAGEGRYFVVEGDEARVAAEVGTVEAQSPFCTTLRCGGGGAGVRTVEHLLSAMEALGVDNCRVEVSGGNEIPLLDGSAQEWVEAIRGAGLCAAEDIRGQKLEKLAPKLDAPVYLRKDDCFVAAFPSSQIHITYGIDFAKVPAIGCQWFTTFLDANIYSSKIAPARTFCIFEERKGSVNLFLEEDYLGEHYGACVNQMPMRRIDGLICRSLFTSFSAVVNFVKLCHKVEKMRGAGLIKGGSLENALVCSMTGGWLNPPLRFEDEPCRHKILDLIGDFSLLAQNGNQGFPIAHVVAYKAGHALHTNFLRHLAGTITADQGMLA